MSTCRQQIADRVNNGMAWKTPSCICSCQLCIKYEVCCVTVGHCGNGLKLQRIAGKARNMMENALSILIVIFSIPLQQTEISERKLFIFYLGHRAMAAEPRVMTSQAHLKRYDANHYSIEMRNKRKIKH